MNARTSLQFALDLPVDHYAASTMLRSARLTAGMPYLIHFARRFGLTAYASEIEIWAVFNEGHRHAIENNGINASPNHRRTLADAMRLLRASAGRQEGDLIEGIRHNLLTAAHLIGVAAAPEFTL